MVKLDSRYQFERRSSLAAIAFVAGAAVLLAFGHAHLSAKLGSAAAAVEDPSAAAMMLTLQRVLRGSALVLFSLALVLVAGLQQVRRLIRRIER